MRGFIIKTVFLAIFTVLFDSLSQAADKGQAFFYISSQCSTPTRVDDNIGNRLAVGDLIQVIYSHGEIDPPDPTKANYLGGDDELFGNFAVGDDRAAWENIGAGEFTISVFGSPLAQVYLRVWDAATISAAGYYDETAAYLLSGAGGVPQDYYLPSFSTTEPKPVEPTATPTMTPTATPSGTPVPTNTPTMTPSPTPNPT